jgi:hypothetical protein
MRSVSICAAEINLGTPLPGHGAPFSDARGEMFAAVYEPFPEMPHLAMYGGMRILM